MFYFFNQIHIIKDLNTPNIFLVHFHAHKITCFERGAYKHLWKK